MMTAWKVLLCKRKIGRSNMIISERTGTAFFATDVTVAHLGVI